ncbi:MAG: restriction endonuclease subunit S, partial [Luteimonas sp.]
VSYPAINASQIMDLLGLVSPLDEQWAIATFLDRETARIDALIATKRRFIALLQEKRAALISRAVTRGLDPDVMLKDSGITWLGSIPEAWALTRIGMLCGVGNGSTPSREEPLYWDDGIHPWLNSSTVNRGVVDYADQFVTGLAIKECHLPPVRPFSILVALTGEGKTRGRAALLTFEATINQHLAYVTPRDERINPRFLRWWLHAHRGALRMLSDGEGGTKGAITCELLKSFPVPLLPHEEQREIARVLDAHDAKVSETARAVDSAIVVLAELRASVIASAVAGKLDTRAAA